MPFKETCPVEERIAMFSWTRCSWSDKDMPDALTLVMAPIPCLALRCLRWLHAPTVGQIRRWLWFRQRTN